MNKQSSIGERLKGWINTKELSASDFANQLQIQRSALSHIFSGRNKPSVDVLLKIKNTYPEINLDWLITGEIIEQKRAVKPETKEKGENTGELKVTDVNTLDKDSDIQNVIISNQTDIRHHNKNRILVRIIELYSDGTFRHFNP